jgi:phosphoglycolate/pyridoxal phosphate phosphatase family enzyme
VGSLRTVLFDCDGVLWNGDAVVPGVPAALQALRRGGPQGRRDVLFITNNSMKTRAQAAAKFEALGFAGVAAADIITSGSSAARYLTEVARLPGSARPRALVVGTPALVAELSAAGVEVVEPPADVAAGSITADVFRAMEPDASVGAVVVGADPCFAYAKLAHAALALQDPGCLFVATNRDAADNVGGAARPRLLPGGGAIVAALAKASGREPVNCGKGGDWMVEMLRMEFGIGAGGAAAVGMVGDRMDTDVAFGRQCGFTTFLPLTGVTTPPMLAEAAAEFRAAYAEGASTGEALAGGPSLPHFVIEDVTWLQSEE